MHVLFVHNGSHRNLSLLLHVSLLFLPVARALQNSILLDLLPLDLVDGVILSVSRDKLTENAFDDGEL